MGTSRAAITKELRAHFIRQSPEGGQFTSGGGSLLRSQVSGGTLYYVAKCPGGCLLRSRVSGGHSTTGGRLLRDRTHQSRKCSRDFLCSQVKNITTRQNSHVHVNIIMFTYAKYDHKAKHIMFTNAEYDHKAK